MAVVIGDQLEISAYGTVPDAIAANQSADVIGIDIPVGLPTDSVRQADTLARKRLGARGAAVFTTPPREVLLAPDYTQARRVAEEKWVQGVSAQAYRLGPRILEVDAIAATDGRIYEIHPELSFQEMKGAPLDWSKKSWNGQMERRALLAESGIELPAQIEGPAGLAGPDDVLDAAAVAWSARRIQTGIGASLPDPPETSSDGLTMAIWY